MTSTPNQETSVSPLKQIRFLENPRYRCPIQAALVRRSKEELSTIVGIVKDNYERWQRLQKRGLCVCHSIEAIKRRFNSGQEKELIIYPKGLQSLCNNLVSITAIFAQIENDTREMLQELRKLSSLLGKCDEVFYRTWQITDFVKFVEELVDLMMKEVMIKRVITQELPHKTSIEDFIYYTTAWEYPRYMDDKVALMFKTLAEEININK